MMDTLYKSKGLQKAIDELTVVKLDAYAGNKGVIEGKSKSANGVTISLP